MAKIACCHNCVYSYWDREHTLDCMSVGLMNWPACANHPASLGRMRRMPERGICPNYRPRPATPQGEVKQIPLGDGYYACVDAADHEWLSQWTWYLGCGYAYRLEKNRMIYMHRQIMQPPKGMVVHHKNRNKLDNTRENMENVTPAENTRLRAKKRNTSSRFWGVSYIKQRAKYQASARYKGKAVACGYFTDEIEAARAHDYKAVELCGECARLNFPEEWPAPRRAEVLAQRDAAGKEKGEGEKAKGRGKRTAAGRSAAPGARPTTKSRRGTGRRPRATSQGNRASPKRRRGRTESP